MPLSTKLGFFGTSFFFLDALDAPVSYRHHPFPRCVERNSFELELRLAIGQGKVNVDLRRLHSSPGIGVPKLPSRFRAVPLRYADRFATLAGYQRWVTNLWPNSEPGFYTVSMRVQDMSAEVGI